MSSQPRPKPAEFHVFDTTLRDGSQQEGLNLSVPDKLTIAALLDELGVNFIEGGWPGANPNDTTFFAAMANGAVKLQNAELVAFGRRPNDGGRTGFSCADRVHRGQEPRPACRASAAHHTGRELGHDHRHGEPPARRGPASLRRL